MNRCTGKPGSSAGSGLDPDTVLALQIEDQPVVGIGRDWKIQAIDGYPAVSNPDLASIQQQAAGFSVIISVYPILTCP